MSATRHGWLIERHTPDGGRDGCGPCLEVEAQPDPDRVEGLADVDGRAAGRCAAAGRSDANGIYRHGLGVAAKVRVAVFQPGFPSTPKRLFDAGTDGSTNPDVRPAR